MWQPCLDWLSAFSCMHTVGLSYTYPSIQHVDAQVVSIYIYLRVLGASSSFDEAQHQSGEPSLAGDDAGGEISDALSSRHWSCCVMTRMMRFQPRQWAAVSISAQGRSTRTGSSQHHIHPGWSPGRYQRFNVRCQSSALRWRDACSARLPGLNLHSGPGKKRRHCKYVHPLKGCVSK